MHQSLSWPGRAFLWVVLVLLLSLLGGIAVSASLAQVSHHSVADGSSMDPDGRQNRLAQGPMIDPNGGSAQRVSGATVNPNGGHAQLAAWPGMDPNG